jgi:hypothetical protein
MFKPRFNLCIAMFCALATSQASCTQIPPEQPGQTNATLPSDVVKYIDKRDLCDHFRGEIPDPSDKTRMEQVNKAIDQYCSGTDAKLASLKAKYKDSKTVQDALSEYDPHIEP